MTFKYFLKQFALEYDHYNQLNLVQRPRKHRVTRFSLRFSSVKNPSIFNSMGQPSTEFQIEAWNILDNIYWCNSKLYVPHTPLTYTAYTTYIAPYWLCTVTCAVMWANIMSERRPLNVIAVLQLPKHFGSFKSIGRAQSRAQQNTPIRSCCYFELVRLFCCYIDRTQGSSFYFLLVEPITLTANNIT